MGKLTKKNFPSMTAACVADVRGVKRYVTSYTCVLMSSIWIKILTTIDIRNQLLQRKDCNLDRAVKNLASLVEDLRDLCNRFDDICRETKLVAENLGIDATFPQLRKALRVKRGDSEMTDEDRFKFDVFYVALDHVIVALVERFRSTETIYSKFSFLWLFPDISNEEVTTAASKLGKEYPDDLNGSILSSQMIALKQVYNDNFQKGKPVPHALLNELAQNGLEEVYDEVATALRIFITIPVSVASGERTFSKLSLIKCANRATMSQEHLNSLATLNINCSLARQIDYTDIIREFAKKQAARGCDF